MIQYEDLVRDLDYWETMLVATMMQRPIKTLIQTDEISEHQQRNLRSAVSKNLKLYSTVVCNGLLGC